MVVVVVVMMVMMMVFIAVTRLHHLGLTDELHLFARLRDGPRRIDRDRDSAETEQNDREEQESTDHVDLSSGRRV